MSESTGTQRINEAIVYGWDGGKARAFTALRPYLRHLGGCWAGENAEPTNSACNCGLRLAYRIRETTEDVNNPRLKTGACS